MSAIISEKLTNWISQSESLQAFYDFNLPKEEISPYTIIKRYDDFFISLYCLSIEMLNSWNMEIKGKTLFTLAKGMETFSLNEEIKKFPGIDFKEAILISATLKYIAGYTSSATLTVFPIDKEDFENNPIALFILCFLKRKKFQSKRNIDELFTDFFNTGDENLIYRAFENSLSFKGSEDLGPTDYIFSILANSLIHNFAVNNIWNSVKKIENNYDFWVDYVRENIKSQIWNFFPSQVHAIEQGIVNSTESFSMQMPTSAGKTALCELIIYYHLRKNPESRVILLAPFRALASELKLSMGKRLRPYGINVKGLYGGNAPTYDEKKSIEESHLLIATPEKMMRIEDVMPEIFDSVTLVICDEGHLLDDRTRGFDYELFLTRLKIIKENTLRFIYLSAIVPNIEDVNKWLGGCDNTIIKSEYRPTTIELAIVTKNIKGNYYLNINPHEPEPTNYRLYGFINKQSYRFLNPKSKRMKSYPIKTKKALSIACALKSLDSGIVAIFSPTKGDNGVKGLCGEAINQLKAISEYNLEVNSPKTFCELSYIDEMIEYFEILFTNEYSLIRCLKEGFVFHHGTLPPICKRNYRRCVEK